MLFATKNLFDFFLDKKRSLNITMPEEFIWQFPLNWKFRDIIVYKRKMRTFLKDIRPIVKNYPDANRYFKNYMLGHRVQNILPLLITAFVIIIWLCTK